MLHEMPRRLDARCGPPRLYMACSSLPWPRSRMCCRLTWPCPAAAACAAPASGPPALPMRASSSLRTFLSLDQ